MNLLFIFKFIFQNDEFIIMLAFNLNRPADNYVDVNFMTFKRIHLVASLASNFACTTSSHLISLHKLLI